jgi:hypothetical protein
VEKIMADYKKRLDFIALERDQRIQEVLRRVQLKRLSQDIKN